MKSGRFILFLFLILDACIEPFNIQLKDSQQVMVVEGVITDQPGPYTVKLFYSLSLEEELNKINWVQGAAVSIYDDQGTVESLHEVTPGIYQTTSIQGVIGRTYHVRITLTDGKEYESVPEALLPVGDLDSVYAEFVQNENPASDNPFTSPNGFNVFLDASVHPEQNGLVRWHWTGTYEVKTYPEFRMKVKVPQGPILDKPIMVPDPPRCSGYIVILNGTSTMLVDKCTCCFCWVEQYNQQPLLSDKKFINNNMVSRFNVAFIPATRRNFFEKYHLEVEQMSTSQVVYDFWKKVESSQDIGSDLFQTTPPRTVGNIRAVSDGAMPALGIFAAAAVKKKSIVILRDEVPYTLLPIDTIANSCLQAYRFSSTAKPVFW